MIETSTKLKPERISAQNNSFTQIRLRIYIPQYYQHEPVISRLIREHGLVINITGAILGATTEGQFDLELRGTLLQIRSGLAYLEALNLKIVGKPNTAGDSWHC